MRHWLVGCLVLLVSSSAWAQPAAEGESEGLGGQLDQAARLLYEAGTRAYDAGHFEEALMRYQNAYQLSQRPALLYNLAVCFDRLDRKAEAADAYARFLDAVPSSPRAAIVRSRIEVLRTSLAREAANADGRHASPLDTDATTDTPADTAVESGDQQSDTGSAPAAVEPRASRSLAGPIVAFSVGGAGLVTFAVAAIVTSGRYGDAKTHCNAGACAAAELNDVNRSALIADLGLGVAVAGAAVGLILLLTGGDDGSEHARLAPALGPNSGGLVVQGRF
ncbi:hypothetical protein GW813_10300 [bacterium]|nr:hypothetical protein [bacterium]